MTIPRRPSFWAALWALPFLHGCALLPVGDTAPAARGAPMSAAAPGDRDLPALLHYYDQLADWPDALLQAEQRIQHATLSEGRCDIPRLKLGLVQLRSIEQGVDVEPAGELLTPCLQAAALPEPGIAGLVSLIGGQLRLAVDGQTSLRTNAQALGALQKENQELKRQLEGLKAIERSLQGRRRR